VADSAFLEQSYAAYSQVENEFQRVMDESLHPRRPGMLDDMVAGLELPAGAAALDVGCGEGGHAIELARRFGLRVLGVDPVRSQVEIARQHLADAARNQPGLSEMVRFALGRAEDLPAGSDSMNLVWCRDVLVHSDDSGSAYREFARVLRPGGWALVYQMFTTSRLEPAEAALLLPVLGCAAASMRPAATEAAIEAAGLRIAQRIVLDSEWGEYAQESSGAGGRQLLHAARLLRDPRRYVRRFGQANYDIALADCLWHIYRMIGKLSARVYLLSPEDAG
jgi:ubiquinone/menaquinone biosynthesis C-methylase UbiE